MNTKIKYNYPSLNTRFNPVLRWAWKTNFKKGWLAYLAGHQSWDNPYKPVKLNKGTELIYPIDAHAWREGWYAAKEAFDKTA